jgi:transposase InsO family protein
MKKETNYFRSHERWAHFRFSVIGPLLAAPPSRGDLQKQLDALASKKWQHPIDGEWTLFGRSTIEGWLYKARRAKEGPVTVLKRKIRSDQGKHPALTSALAGLLATQHCQHPSWSYQLHADNLVVLVENEPTLGKRPSYRSVVRFMKSHGLFKRPRRGPVHSPGAQAAELRYEAREIRSYEAEYVNTLWHLDFHYGSLRVLLANGTWVYPMLLGILDDHSRLCCHVQWYLNERAEELCHGLCQAFQKRQLPRSILFDNGSAMIASETEQGLTRLSVVFEHTLPFSPFQNGKQESFWNQIEGRLLPMLEGVADLTLDQLNLATQAWSEVEYNREVHSEIKETPLARYLNHKDVSQPCPDTQKLKLAFTTEVKRTQRRSDGTISLEGIRFEIPSRYAHLETLFVRYASWDMGSIYLADPITGTVLCRIYPVDKKKNAEGPRALRTPAISPSAPVAPPGIAPLLAKILHQYALTGLPPAYLPNLKNPSDHE